MPISPLAGQRLPDDHLLDVDALRAAYYSHQPDLRLPEQRVVFGTSGHRGSPFTRNFNEAHLLAIAQAVVDYRADNGITGPLFVGKDTHAASDWAYQTVLEVLTANQVQIVVETDHAPVPTPVISRAIIRHNDTSINNTADGLIITPSHNPPEDGGIKYNSTHGGPAETAITTDIEHRANAHLQSHLRGVRTVSLIEALDHDRLQQQPLNDAYINELEGVLDMNAISTALNAQRFTLAADAMGGAGGHLWARIAQRYHFPLAVFNREVDPQFAFVPADHDGRIRMDCSSAHAMTDAQRRGQHYDLVLANDTDFDRHGIVSAGALIAPNHYLALAIDYLCRTRTGWGPNVSIGKTVVSSGLIDAIVTHHRRALLDVPVGFKWFVEGLSLGQLGFAGEESAGASFLQFDGSPWTTDKDGFVMTLLAVEMTATTGQLPNALLSMLLTQHGTGHITRRDTLASTQEKAALSRLSVADVHSPTLGGDPITSVRTTAPGNDAPIGGVKITTQFGWIAARPSGTEAIYKLYGESFRSAEHLNQLLEEGENLIQHTLVSCQ